MADEFKKKMDHAVGKGGVRCKCCNTYHGSSRKKLRRLARRQLKQIDHGRNCG